MNSLLALRRTALASVAVNIGIVITGGAVRLTGSGLGCPTWPRCTDDSYVATPAMGVNGAIEFGNRMLTFVVGLVAVLGVVAALRQRPRRRRVVRLAALVLLGVCGQALLGGLTVRTRLNPDVVGGHFLLSMALIAAAYAFWRATGETDQPARPAVPALPHALARVLTATSLAVIVAGTLVTGSGPHAGDAAAARNSLAPQAVAQLHGALVFLLVAVAAASWLALRLAGAPDAAAPDAAVRSAAVRVAAVRVAWLIGIIAAQGLIGFVQYASDLPAILVGAHLAGACAVWLGTLVVLHSTRTRDSTRTRADPDLGRAEDRTSHPTPRSSVLT